MAQQQRTTRHVLLLLLVIFGLSLSPVINAQNDSSNANNSNTSGSSVGNANNVNNSNTPSTSVNASLGNTLGAGGAQTKVASTPSSLLVAGVRGSLEKRNLLLQVSEPVVIKQIITSDLTRADGGVVLPAEKIEVLSLDQSATDFQRFAVTLNLQDASGGEFTGDIKVVHSKGIQSVPLVVRVKHGCLLPLVILLAGIILGTALTAYRTRGKLRDEVLVRQGNLRAQMRTDADLSTALAKPFWEQLNNYLMDVQLALDAAKWDDARTAMEKAEKVFNTWSQYRQSWMEQLRYHALLAERLLELKKLKVGVLSAYLLKIERALDDAVQEAASVDNPKVLRDKLDIIWQWINDYVRLQSRINELKRIIGQLPATTMPDVVKLWEARSQELERRLDNLLPTDPNYATAYNQLQTDIEQSIVEVSKLIPHSLGTVSLSGGIDGVPPPPLSSRPSGDELQGASAANRLRVFTLVAYLIALIFMAGIGFGELYIGRATFSTWNDYFALLAWGFGAEATRASVAQTVRNLGLHGIST